MLALSDGSDGSNGSNGRQRQRQRLWLAYLPARTVRGAGHVLQFGFGLGRGIGSTARLRLELRSSRPRPSSPDDCIPSISAASMLFHSSVSSTLASSILAGPALPFVSRHTMA